MACYGETWRASAAPRRAQSAQGQLSRVCSTRLGARAASDARVWSSQMASADTAERNREGTPLTTSGRPWASGAQTPGPEPSWLPSTGIPSGDGQHLYTMALIDLLGAFSWKSKVQVSYQEIVSCGQGSKYSKLPPPAYAERQLEMLERMCGRGAEESDEEETTSCSSAGSAHAD
mmetsp:Transcript_19074/g.59993  ORF Transcript_19074/g.59993 Transcript_19074/m.59993 type:complete len:175 (-) Transcript_19074:179-703(-)